MPCTLFKREGGNFFILTDVRKVLENPTPFHDYSIEITERSTMKQPHACEIPQLTSVRKTEGFVSKQKASNCK